LFFKKASLKGKLFIFYGSYLDCLFLLPEDNEIYLKLLSEMIQSYKIKSKLVQLQANDSLNGLVFIKSFKMRNIGNMEKILMNFQLYLKEKNCVTYYENLFEIVKLYYEIQNKREISMVLFEEIVKKLENQFIGNNNNEDINECEKEIEEICFKIIRFIIDNDDEKIRENIRNIENLMYNLLNTDNKCIFSNYFDKEILHILAKLMSFFMEKEMFMKIVLLFLKRYGKFDDALVLFINNFLYFYSNDADSYEYLHSVLFYF